MHLRDVLKVVGESELERFPWGRNVVSLINGFVKPDQQISLSSKGDQINAAISSIDEVTRELLLAAKVNLDGFISQAAPAANDEISEEASTHKTKSIAVLLFLGVLCFIAVVLTLSSSYVHVKGGEMDTGGLKLVLETILVLLNGS